MAAYLDTPVGQLIQGQPLVTLQPNLSVRDALALMANNNLTSAPIVIENKLQSFVDVLDILAHLIRVASEPLSSFYQERSKNLSTDDMEFLYQRTQHFNLTSILTVNNLSKLDPAYTLPSNAPLREALRIMKDRVHRIGVLGENGELMGVLSQSDVVHTFGQQLGGKLEKPVNQMTNLTEKVVCVPEMTRAIDAFFKMHKNRLSAVGIVDDEGKLVGNLSASDLKALLNFPFTRLLEMVPDYIRFIRNQNGKPLDYSISVTGTVSLKEAMKKMCEEHVHRVYIVDDNKKPIGVASFQDFIQEMLLEFQGSSE